jgi:hypothetical protein
MFSFVQINYNDTVTIPDMLHVLGIVVCLGIVGAIWHSSFWLIPLCLPKFRRNNESNSERIKGAIMTNDASVTLPATVEKVLPAKYAEPEKVQISVDGCDELFSELRVENALKDEAGDSVTLKRGAHLEVTINANSKALTKKE